MIVFDVGVVPPNLLIDISEADKVNLVIGEIIFKIVGSVSKSSERVLAEFCYYEIGIPASLVKIQYDQELVKAD